MGISLTYGTAQMTNSAPAWKHCSMNSVPISKLWHSAPDWMRKRCAVHCKSSSGEISSCAIRMAPIALPYQCSVNGWSKMRDLRG